ncbi:MAG TPA: response regulator transcription factor [Terracidiphilus sp.]|nr:response regulator transcription factor [Terracidiphilus sp.]
MYLKQNPKSIRVGLLAGEPIRLEGLTSVFEKNAGPGEATLVPVVGTLDELMADSGIEYLVVDLNSSPGRKDVLEAAQRARPDIRLIVIGPEGSDELVMESIIAGARAYLDSTAGTREVRQALDVVVSGSIWAPRRLLSKLIDRLISNPDGSLANVSPHLTAREREVLELILLAHSNREIALELGIEERTVKAHLGRLMRKMGAENRIELSMRALGGSIAPRGGIQAGSKAGMTKR